MVPSPKSIGPKSIGIIMDGNRRWAKERKLFPFKGHQAGLEKLKETLSWAQEVGISEVTFYAFSSENWNREQEEVSHMLELIEYAFGEWIEEIIQNDVCVRVIGERSKFSQKIQNMIERVELLTKDGKKGTLVIALSYGGRAEILNAVNKVLASSKEQVTEEDFRNAMWSNGLSDPDLIIRTGGEQRLSNFLTWQSVYSELFFTDTKWPAFTKEEFDSIISEFSQRERRHGK